jgi:hypothetical protein
MAGELTTPYTSGAVVYLVVIDAHGNWWDGSAFEPYQDAHWASYAIPAVELGTSGNYLSDFPAAAPPGHYSAEAYARAGATPAVSDSADGPVATLPDFAWQGPSPAGTDLISLETAASALSELDLTAAQLAYLPRVITAASDAVRRSCGDRDFDLRQYDRIFALGLDGGVSLPQIPVQKVSRVAAGRAPALTIVNTDRSTNQRATVEFECSGDESVGITYTGILLARKASGVTATAPLEFASYPTIAALAAAVNALGGGWSATTAAGFEAWGTDELIAQDDTAQDTFSGATLDVWANDLQGCKVAKRTGELDVSSGRVLGVDGPRWGPGWEVFELDEREAYSKVRVVYTAGFATIPAPVQQAVAMTAAAMFSALMTDPRLASSSDGDFSYDVAVELAAFGVPPAAASFLWPYVIHHV